MIKKNCLIVCFFLFGLQSLWAVNCTYDIRQSNIEFSLYEITSATFSVISPLLNVQKIKPLEEAGSKGPCHLKFAVTQHSNVLAVNLFYSEKHFSGGSPKSTLDGFREALVRAFYKEKEFQKKTCAYFGEKYHLNCVLFKK